VARLLEFSTSAVEKIERLVRVEPRRFTEDPFNGHVFVFRGKRGDLVKLLWWSGDGMNLYAKRLEKNRFVWPVATSGTVHLSAAQLSMLLEGIDWRSPKRMFAPTRAA
jgi:transposase